MRLTIRILLSMMSAIESGLDEIANRIRNDEKMRVYYLGITVVKRNQATTRSYLHGMLDQMIDDGEGD